MSFADTGLDPRLLRALSKKGYAVPTPVQAQAIPKVLEGKDVVARARTGSGKTMAYVLPALHKVLTGSGGRAGWQVLVLVPTRELCEQVFCEAQSVAELCGDNVKVTSLSKGSGPPAAQRAAVTTAGQVVVSTPGRVAQALADGSLSAGLLAGRLHTLVLDEADLLLSYGYEEDLRGIAPQVPRSCQCLLMSATSSEDVERLQKLVLHSPVHLDLLAGVGAEGGPGAEGGAAARGGDASGAASEIQHWAVHCEAGDRLLHTLALLKLNTVRKKVLLFVNSIDEGIRLRLFLEAFGVQAALLNSELPLNSRHHILQEFNKGLFDYLIATDDVHAAQHPLADKQHERQKGGKAGARKGWGSKRKRERDEEFGVTRGIDFKGVRTVINYDAPATVEGYVHRVGRTGRAGNQGTAVSLLTPQDAFLERAIARQVIRAGGSSSATLTLNPSTAAAQLAVQGQAARAEDDPSTVEDDDPTAAVAAVAMAVPSPVVAAAAGGGGDGGGGVTRGGGGVSAGGGEGRLEDFGRLTRAAVEALRYRAEDVARSVTKLAVKEARAKELRMEVLNSERLAAHFEAHPADLALLKHDKPLAKGPAAPHLKRIPAYLRDPALGGGRSSTGNRGKGVLPWRKRQKLAAGLDPVKGFVRAPKRGGGDDEEMTEMEQRAAAAAKKDAKKAAKKGGGKGSFLAKRNVRRNKPRKR